MISDSLTICLGVDQKTLAMCDISIPTWRLHRPEMWDYPWFIFYDASIPIKEIEQFCRRHGLDKPDTGVAVWNPKPEIPFFSQRAKMLTAWGIMPPRYVTTKWWMKIDADVVAFKSCEWIGPTWDELIPLHDICTSKLTPTNLAEPVVIAPRWGYTKAKGSEMTVKEWAALLDSFGDSAWPNTRSLHLNTRVEGGRIKFRRWCSWLSFYQTTWTKEICETFETFCGPDALPVPSQDTSYWYASARRRDAVLTPNMKRRGWSNHSRSHELNVAAKKSLANTPV